MAAVLWNEQQAQLPWRGDIGAEEVAKHNTRADCWVIVEGQVYDVTAYLDAHPTDADCILRFAGQDMTPAFKQAHGYLSPNVISKACIGRLKP
jgi:cytochrome b involved in lipid metabolism